jgi:hypothetical protein
MSFKSLSIVAAAALALCAGAVQAQNRLANGGFEATGPTAATPATSWLKGAAGYSLSSDARTGSFAALLNSPALNAAVVLQNSVEQGGLPALNAGDNLFLSFWAKGTAGATGNATFALRYLDGIGNILYDSLAQSFTSKINTSSYTQITFNAAPPVPTGAVAAFIEFGQAIGPIGTGPAGENWFAGNVLIDDVSLVPEPGSYALMLAGLGVVGMIVRRRRRQA